MFAYTMLATSPLFCYADWPRRFFSHFPKFLWPVLPMVTPPPQPSSSCLYPSPSGRSTKRTDTQTVSKPSTQCFRHKMATIFTIVYIVEQFFMPYSHFITKVISFCLDYVMSFFFFFLFCYTVHLSKGHLDSICRVTSVLTFALLFMAY